jgi:hypothetical protein
MVDRSISDFRLPAHLGGVVFGRKDAREPQGGVSIADARDREVTGYEFALRGRAKEAERALEEACLARFGSLRPDGCHAHSM